MNARSIVVAASLLLTLPLVASPAFAQNRGFATNRFEPGEGGSDWFALDALDVRGSLRPSIKVVGDWGYRPLAVYAPDGSVMSEIIRHQVFLRAGASIVFIDRFRASISVPVQVYAEGEGGVANGQTFPAPSSSTSFGDMRLSFDSRLVGTTGAPFIGAVGLRVWLPTGDSASYAGDSAVRFSPRAIVAGDLGPLAYSAFAGAQVRGQSGTFGGSTIGSELVFGGAAGLRFANRALLIGPEIYGSTVFARGAELFARQSTPVEGLFGAHFTIADDFHLSAGAGTGLTRGLGSPLVRGLVAFEWRPTEQPPPPPPPPPAAEPDRDGDGILDRDDACPEVKGESSDDPKKNGCPPDRDGDTVLDSEDACPDVPGLRTSNRATNGCPDPDRDKDGIPNETDACPDQAGKPNANPKLHGCPIAFITQGVIQIADQVRFKTNSAEILPGKESEEVLQAVLEVIKTHWEIKRIRIEGHTDDRGSAQHNKALSGRRAQSVVNWLVAHGIEKDRLTSAGFGLERPIEPNTTDEGRAKNRRVEFHIESTSSDATKP